MKSLITAHISYSYYALFIALLIAISASYIDRTQDTLESMLRSNIDRQVTVIKNLLIVTDRNGADAVTESIILDCPKRQEFEDLLIRLDSLSKKDLLTTQQLFDSCGGFYAERKSLMVSSLEREYKVLTDNTNLLAVITELEPELQTILRWNEIIELEKNRSALLTDQTRIQAEIISSLINENAPRDQVRPLIEEAQEIGQSLSVADKQIDELRVVLID